MAQHDLKKNGVITFMEFKALFFDIVDLEAAETFNLLSNPELTPPTQ
jgi:hypothetical protein